MSLFQRQETQSVKRILLTLQRSDPQRKAAPKQLAFFTGETVTDIINAGREYWRISSASDLRLCHAAGGFALEPWLTVAELSTRPEVELVLIAR